MCRVKQLLPSSRKSRGVIFAANTARLKVAFTSTGLTGHNNFIHHGSQTMSARNLLKVMKQPGGIYLTVDLLVGDMIKLYSMRLFYNRASDPYCLFLDLFKTI